MTNAATGIGHSQRTIGSSWKTATRKSASEARQKTTTWARLSSPLGSSRPAVRGLRASIRASISRFRPIASERAPTIASVIQTRSCALGTPATARKAATTAVIGVMLRGSLDGGAWHPRSVDGAWHHRSLAGCYEDPLDEGGLAFGV